MNNQENKTNDPLDEFLSGYDENIFVSQEEDTFKEEALQNETSEEPDAAHTVCDYEDVLEEETPNVQEELIETAQSIQESQPNAQSHTPFSFEDAMAKAQADSDKRITNAFAAVPPIFSYANVKEDIDDKQKTFDSLREQYEIDFPELSDKKKVSWNISYGKIIKTVKKPESDKVYALKKEIEESKEFLDAIRVAKNEKDREPKCLVIPKITAQSKGKTNSYKGIYKNFHEAFSDDKQIKLVPSRDKQLYEIRCNEIGIFTTPAALPPEEVTEIINSLKIQDWEKYKENDIENSVENSIEDSIEDSIESNIKDSIKSSNESNIKNSTENSEESINSDFYRTLDPISPGFAFMLPKIPFSVLLSVISLFKKFAEWNLEVMVYILYNKITNEYHVHIPTQYVSNAGIEVTLSNEDLQQIEGCIHVMDIHSHHKMPARFSKVDDSDEQTTRLYTVVGRTDSFFPQISVRASNAGKFLNIMPEQVFETVHGAIENIDNVPPLNYAGKIFTKDGAEIELF